MFCYGFGLIFQNAPTFWILKKVKKFILRSSSRYFQGEEGEEGGRGVLLSEFFGNGYSLRGVGLFTYRQDSTPDS